MLISLLSFAQSLPAIQVPDVVSTGVASLVLILWRQDRKDREADRDLHEKRYQALAEDFRKIVQDNTEAITSLRDALTASGRVSPGKEN